MKEYTGFAQVYDIFMDNVPYDEWTEYLTELLMEHKVKDGLVLELGCGTGNITRRLAAKGYDMIGIDISEEMLEIAREFEYDSSREWKYNSQEENDSVEFKLDYHKDDTAVVTTRVDTTEVDEDTDLANVLGSHSEIDFNEEFKDGHYDEDSDFHEADSSNILYLQQDMREFELFGTVAAVVSICDSMNYITSEEDLLKVFQLVNNYLDEEGIFIFDMNTEYKYKHVLSDKTIAENREDCSFIWENYYHEDKMLNEYDVTIFVKIEEEDEDQLFERFQETHYQKAYSYEQIIELLEKSGMEFIAVYDAFTHKAPQKESERVYFIAREKQQAQKKYL